MVEKTFWIHFFLCKLLSLLFQILVLGCASCSVLASPTYNPFYRRYAHQGSAYISGSHHGYSSGSPGGYVRVSGYSRYPSHHNYKAAGLQYNSGRVHHQAYVQKPVQQLGYVPVQMPVQQKISTVKAEEMFPVKMSSSDLVLPPVQDENIPELDATANVAQGEDGEVFDGVNEGFSEEVQAPVEDFVEQSFLEEPFLDIEQEYSINKPLGGDLFVENDFPEIDLRDALNQTPENILFLEPVPAVPGLPVGLQEPAPGTQDPADLQLFNLTPVPAVPGLQIAELQI